MRILIIDNEERTANYVRQGLKESGFVIDVANSGGTGIFYCKENEYDLLLIDTQLSDMSGRHALKLLRKLSAAAILVLTAKNQLDEKLESFALGADDFLPKPFQFPELLARIQALLRRPPIDTPGSVLLLADLRLDPQRHQVYRGEQRLRLTAREFALLYLLLRHKGKVVTRRKIISALWDSDACYNDAAVSVTICRLRNQVDGPFASKLIHTARGIGYILEERAHEPCLSARA